MTFQRFHPLARGHIVTSEYGPRWGTTHYGRDYGWPGGSANKPVYAVQAGTVVVVASDPGGFGRYVDIDSDDAQGSNLWVYGHIVPQVKVGQKVKAGERIGYINPDRATNGGVDPHVHVEVHKYTRQPAGPGRMNPAPFLKDALYPGEAAAAPVPTPAAPAAPTTGGKPLPTYTMNEIDLTGTHNSHSARWGAKPWLFVLHTQEGPGSARSLHDYFSRAQVSYHYTVDNKEIVGSVNTDRASWSVLDANPYTINLCFAGSRAAMSREEWLSKYSNAIDFAAQAAVRDCLQYGIGTRVHARDYAKIKQRVSGIIDHSGITYGLNIGDHTDVGLNFPWDVFTERVRFWVEGGTVPAPAPVLNAIDEEAKIAASWLGKRLTTGEGDAIDGGKYAHFENGSIYWHARTGAWAIPKSIFEKYSEMRWEQSFLGFPVGRHTVLTVPVTGQAWGDVQAFEGGAIYRKYNQPGYVVTGAIRERWNRTGFENGDFGWPTSDEIKLEGGAVKQTFERGVIIWSPDGTVALKPLDGPDEIVQPAH